MLQHNEEILGYADEEKHSLLPNMNISYFSRVLGIQAFLWEQYSTDYPYWFILYFPFIPV